MQKKITKAGDLLDENGYLQESGYATKLIKTYDRKKIKAKKSRIKEWDYYLVYNNDYAVALTIDDNSYMGLNSISLIDFKNKTETTKSFMAFNTKGKTNLPSTSKIGNVVVQKKNYSISFINDGRERVLKAKIQNFQKGKDLACEFVLTKEPKDSMVILTPFAEKKTHFYYNQKIVGLLCEGWVELGGEKVLFEKKSTRGILDWGRGVWTYKNTWYWGAGTGVVDGHEVGFNIGYGFGDTSNATENMVFYDGKAHKLSDVTFNIPKDKRGRDDFMSPWTFSSSDKRFEMKFTPVINRHSNANILVISSNQNQVFGKFSGKIKLDDGTIVKLKNFMGFAEKVVNKW
ncbi:MAG: DUF2804 domain-containing protein [Clostridia bacterium]|nr:DUF2804 domain-containing protein [Clostridia bacterium]